MENEEMSIRSKSVERSELWLMVVLLSQNKYWQVILD
jgi:hypothetical protein